MAVSISNDNCDQPTALLRVHRRERNWQPRHNFTICPAPLNRKYDKLGELLQYIEVNGMFGADHFLFYNNSMSDRVQTYLQYYVSIGKAEILNWDMPIIVEQGPTNEIHYFGQVVAQCECFNRAMMTSRFVAALDMDEVIIPMKTSSWQSILDKYDRDGKGALFLFPNTFFRKEWTPNQRFANDKLMQKYPIDALLYTRREPKVWSHGMRSKYIARPERIVLPGIHDAFDIESGSMRVVVPHKEGLLAHYRNWEDFRESTKQDETRMHNFSDEVFKRLAFIDSMVQA